MRTSILLIFLTCISRSLAGDAVPSQSPPTTQPSAPPASIKVIFERELEDKSVLQGLREEKIIQPSRPAGGALVPPEFLAPIHARVYTVLIRKPTGEVQQIYKQLNAQQANPTTVDVLDVAVNAAGNLAVVVWNEDGLAWALVTRKVNEGDEWNALSAGPRDAGSLGPSVKRASVQFKADDNAVVVSVDRTNDETVRYRSDLSPKATWRQEN